MLKYITKRMLLMVPTLIGISLVCFIIINMAPGGPIERIIQQMKFSGGGGAQVGVSEEVIEALKKQYGFDKPILVRYGIWVKNIVTFDFGTSFTYQEPVLKVIAERFPVSLQFGLISLLLVYLICIPLGIFKAVKDGSAFDNGTSFVLFVMYSIPTVMMAILLIVFFASSSYLDIFPIGEIYSDEYFDKGFFGKVLDRAHHFVLPLICYMLHSFSALTFLMKNSFLDQVKLDYVRTARAKGLDEKSVLYKHTLRNALIPIVTGLNSFLLVMFNGSIIIEQIFQLDGIGLLTYRSVLDGDYNVLMALIFIPAVLLLVGRLLTDIAYTFIDPRIDFK